MEKKSNFFVSLIALLLPLGVGYLSSVVTRGGGGSFIPYPIKPPLVPPASVFPIVWAILFTLMGIAFSMVINTDTDKETKKIAIFVFLLQLALNFFWSILFFKYRLCGLAFIDIALLWFMIFVNFIVFYRIRKTAGYLLIPYLLWVGFALYLNAGYCILN